jgi:hypothetical protein
MSRLYCVPLKKWAKFPMWRTRISLKWNKIATKLLSICKLSERFAYLETGELVFLSEDWERKMGSE